MGGTKCARSGATRLEGMSGGCGGPTCELAAQQLHPEGAVPPAHLGVQPDVLSLDGRCEGVGVRGVVVHVPAEHLPGEAFAQRKVSGGSPQSQRVPVSQKHLCCSVCARFSPGCSCFSASSAQHKFPQQNDLPWCCTVLGLPPVLIEGLCFVTPRNCSS